MEPHGTRYGKGKAKDRSSCGIFGVEDIRELLVNDVVWIPSFLYSLITSTPDDLKVIEPLCAIWEAEERYRERKVVGLWK